MGLEANTFRISDKAQYVCFAQVKSKNRVNCIDCFDLDNDGVWPQLVMQWKLADAKRSYRATCIPQDASGLLFFWLPNTHDY